MFDCYEPVPALACPFCAAPLGGWQGKGGPCLLLTWKQGVRSPLQGDSSKEEILPDGTEYIYTSCSCCGQWIDVEVFVVEGIWISSRFEKGAPPAIAADRIACAIDKFIENCPFVQSLVDLYTDRKAAGRWPVKS